MTALDRTAAAPARFLLTATAWALALFALLRTPIVVDVLTQRFTQAQVLVAAWYGGAAVNRLFVTIDCSAADLLALTVAVILAFPVPAGRRLIGVAGAILVIAALNVIRLISLAAVTADPVWFDRLHLIAWPALLAVAACAFVLAWMRIATRGRIAASTSAIAVGAAALLAFAFVEPFAAASVLVVRAGAAVAGTAAALLRAAGIAASASGDVLQTPFGAFVVTHECLLSPVLPIGIAAACAAPARRGTRALLAAAVLPAFLALSIVRLALVALPVTLAVSPLHVVHGFYQLVAFAAVAAGVGRWRGSTAVRIGTACAVAAIASWLAGDAYRSAVVGIVAHAGPLAAHARLTWTDAGDLQGALLWMPVYQLALFAVLVAVGRTRWSRAAIGGAALALSHAVALVAIGELSWRWHVAVHPLVWRAWAIAAPLGVWAAVTAAETAASAEADRRYRAFWTATGERFPDLGGAASTALYARDEQRLLERWLGEVRGRRVFKTDLWDEAKNTRILQWLAARGARVCGIDLSAPIVRAARAEFGTVRLAAAQADVRYLPLADRSVTAIYSMGTVEHFPETTDALRELYRVLAPGGLAVIGVPNRHDPFLRPALVAALSRLGLYGYGAERSFSRRELRRMLEDAGFEIVDESGILFIPGWLRMADLWAHTACPGLEPLIRPFVRAFGALTARWPRLNRHGYLLATLARRPVV